MAKTYGKTPSGRVITEEFVEQAVAEAEAGYDLSKATVRPGPGRRPTLGDEAAQVESVRLGPELARETKARASTEGITKAELIRKALREYLARPA